MFETLGFEDMTPQQVSVVFALAIGILFGLIAQHTKFCFRRGIVGDIHERAPARGVWFTALAFAIIGTQALVAFDLISFSDHRFFNSNLPLLAIGIGGLLFGAGMILTRGCISRLTVLVGTGNLRAMTVLLVFALIAHATLKGVFAPLRVFLGSFTIDMGEYVSLGSFVGGNLVWASVLILAILVVVLRSGSSLGQLSLAAVLGLLVPLAWIGTGYILFDEFDPIEMQSLSFTLPSAETLFWVVASSAIPAGFGVGLLGGTILGAFLGAVLKKEFVLQSFETPAQTLQYLMGGALMGIGGVLAGGCTVGAGLAGIPSLSIAALLALGFTALGAVLTNQFVNREQRVKLFA